MSFLGFKWWKPVEVNGAVLTKTQSPESSKDLLNETPRKWMAPNQPAGLKQSRLIKNQTWETVPRQAFVVTLPDWGHLNSFMYSLIEYL